MAKVFECHIWKPFEFALYRQSGNEEQNDRARPRVQRPAGLPKEDVG